MSLNRALRGRGIHRVRWSLLLWLCSGCGGAPPQPVTPDQSAGAVDHGATDSSAENPSSVPSLDPRAERVEQWRASLESVERAVDATRACSLRVPEGTPAETPIATVLCQRRNSASIYLGLDRGDHVVTIGGHYPGRRIESVEHVDAPPGAVALDVRSASWVGPNGGRPTDIVAHRVACSVAGDAVGCLTLLTVYASIDRPSEGYRAELILDGSADGVRVRVAGEDLSEGLDLLRGGLLLGDVIEPTAHVPVEEMEQDLELARLFRATTTGVARTRRFDLVDPEQEPSRSDAITWTEPRDALLWVLALGPMPDVWESRLIVRLVDAPESGLAVITSMSCRTGSPPSARGGWPRRAIGPARALDQEITDVLTDVRGLPEPGPDWTMHRGALCHGTLCSDVLLAGTPSFLTTVRAILESATFTPTRTTVRSCRD